MIITSVAVYQTLEKGCQSIPRQRRIFLESISKDLQKNKHEKYLLLSMSFTELCETMKIIYRS